MKQNCSYTNKNIIRREVNTKYLLTVKEEIIVSDKENK